MNAKATKTDKTQKPSVQTEADVAKLVGAKVPEPTIAPETGEHKVTESVTSEVTSNVSPLKKFPKVLPEGHNWSSMNKSEQIRTLHDMGWSTGDIARSIGVIYQHARNVLEQYKKKQAKQASKSQATQSNGTNAA